MSVPIHHGAGEIKNRLHRVSQYARRYEIGQSIDDGVLCQVTVLVFIDDHLRLPIRLHSPMPAHVVIPGGGVTRGEQ